MPLLLISIHHRHFYIQQHQINLGMVFNQANGFQAFGGMKDGHVFAYQVLVQQETACHVIFCYENGCAGQRIYRLLLDRRQGVCCFTDIKSVIGNGEDEGASLTFFRFDTYVPAKHFNVCFGNA